MPQISLTDFVDFVASSGSPKQTKVRTVKNRGDYSPAFDFWKRFREGVAEYHQSGSTQKSDLDIIASSQTDQKKITAYPAPVVAYKKFLGRKTINWFAPVSNLWASGGTEVRVNPELGLDINGTKHLVKLYMKAEPLSKRKVEVILALMHDALSATAPAGACFAVLDVPRGVLYSSNTPNPGVIPLLHGEAISFAVIWNSLP